MEKSTHTTAYARLQRALRSAREAASLSQRALAAKLDVSPSWVAKVESGERRIDLVEFCWFVSACDADPQAMFAELTAPTRRTRHGGGA